MPPFRDSPFRVVRRQNSARFGRRQGRHASAPSAEEVAAVVPEIDAPITRPIDRDARHGQERPTIGMAFTSDGHTLATASDDDKVILGTACA